MSCERYRDALTDAAAGESGAPAFEAHLESCAGCRSALARLRQLLSAADESLSALAAAEPSPALRVRIRAAVAESESAPALRWGFAWSAAAAAVLALAALGAWRAVVARAPVAVVAEGARPSPSAAAPSAARESEPAATSAPRTADAVPPPGKVPVRSTPDVARRSSAGPVRTSAAPSREARVANPEAEVLVPSGGQEALLRFVALVHRDGLHAPTLAATGQPSADLVEPADIDIRPLEIVPLAPAESSGT